MELFARIVKNKILLINFVKSTILLDVSQGSENAFAMKC